MSRRHRRIHDLIGYLAVLIIALGCLFLMVLA